MLFIRTDIALTAAKPKVLRRKRDRFYPCPKRGRTPLHPEGSAHARQPAAAHRQLHGVPGRVFAQRAGYSRQLRVPQPDPAAVPRRRPGHPDREAHLARHQPQPRPSEPPRRLGQASRPRRPRHGYDLRELVRCEEQNNEEAGEHWTPRDAVRLMAKLVFQPIADQISSGTTCCTTAPAAPAACCPWPRRRTNRFYNTGIATYNVGARNVEAREAADRLLEDLVPAKAQESATSTRSKRRS